MLCGICVQQFVTEISLSELVLSRITGRLKFEVKQDTSGETVLVSVFNQRLPPLFILLEIKRVEEEILCSNY